MSYPDVTWMDTAACARPEHRELPWLAEPDQLSPDELARLRQVCSGCPVATPCAQYAARLRVRTGFWCGAHRGSGKPVQLALDLGRLARLDQLGESA